MHQNNSSSTQVEVYRVALLELDPGDLDAQLASFSKTSAIGLAILDNQYRFRFVNNAVVAMHNGIRAEVFGGTRIRSLPVL